MFGRIVELACDAAAVALNAMQGPSQALTLLEQGRGLLVSSLDDMRADILELSRQYPELADEYKRSQATTPPPSIFFLKNLVIRMIHTIRLM